MKEVRAVHVSDSDTCVTLIAPAEAGDIVRFTERGCEKSVTANESIPQWHKIAIKPVAKDGVVLKYGAVIGIATEDIAVGDYVHVHNMRSPGMEAKR